VDWNKGGSAGPAEGFAPIGNSSTDFTGSYDGGGYTIDNLYIYRPSTDYIALFGYTNDATITNIGVTNVDITGRNYVGGIVGWHNGFGGTMSYSYTTGSVHGEDYGSGSSLGPGINVGGIMGYTNGGTILNSYSTASVSGYESIGGLLGTNSYGTISKCYAAGSVSGTNDTGGLVGSSTSTDVFDSFWDKETTGQLTSSGDGTALTTTQMRDYNTFTEVTNTTVGLTSAWDFIGTVNDDAATVDIWDMDQVGTVNNGYPILSWQDGADDMIFSELTWNGTTDSDWNTTSNWDEGKVPDGTVDVIIPDVTTDPVISASTAAEIDNLTVESNATLTIQSDASNNGSLIVNGTSSGEVTYNRYVTANNWHLIASPVSGQSISDFVTGHSIATQDGYCAIAPYDNATHAWVHYTDTYSETDVFTSGKGYEVQRTANGTLPFTGTINTSDVSIDLTTPVSPGKKWNLIGNSFTTAINANDPAGDPVVTNFLTNNSAVLDAGYQAIYVWDPTKDSGVGGYVTINHSSTQSYVAPGQAFFVYAVDGGGSVTFEEGTQNGQTGNIFKSGETGHSAITLYAENEGLKKSTQIKYIGEMTTGLDPGYDAGRFSAGDNNFFISTRLVGDQTNQTDLDIQCLPLGDYSHIIPVGVNAAAGNEIVFSVETNNLPADVPVILEDRQKGVFTTLHENGDIYQIVTETKQEGTGRFYLYSQEISTRIDNREEMPEVFVIPIPRYNKLRITGDLEKGATVSVYDIAGRKLVTSKLNPSQINDVDMHAINSGIYIVEINSATRRLSRKINWAITR
jgi:hypothetical protein